MPEYNYTLTFIDGTSIQFAAGSTILDLISICDTFAEIDDIRAKLTEENLKGATFNGETIENIVPVDVEVYSVKPDEKLEVHFHNSKKSDLAIMQEQITELQEALAEIAG